MLLAQGAAIAGMGLGPQNVLAGSGFVVGVTAGVASVLLSAVFQAEVDGAYLGRMTSITQLGDGMLMPVSMPVSMAGFGAWPGWPERHPASRRTASR